MAHSCPHCDQYCTCGGDIDDMQLDGTSYQANCYHCECDDENGEELNFDCEVETGTCSKCGKIDQVTETFIFGEKQPDVLCYECAGEGGFCAACGTFASGTEAYDFSKIGHYCENCQDQIRDAFDDGGDDLDDWEYPDYPTNKL